MRLLIDSNRYTDFAKGVPDVVARFESASEIWISLIVLAELRGGFAFGSKRNKNEEGLAKFLSWPDVHLLAPDEATVDHYVAVYSALRRRGKPIPTNDMWIAALAIQHDLILDARDRDFHNVPGLKLIDRP